MQGRVMKNSSAGLENSHQREDVAESPDEGADDGNHQKFGANFNLWTCHSGDSQCRNRM